MSICGLQKYHLLHSSVGCTADVPGDHRQAARTDAGHHSSQVFLEPQLKVLRLKVDKFRSKGCQGQVQDGVSYAWISDDSDVSLEMKGFVCQLRGTVYLSQITVEMRASLAMRLIFSASGAPLIICGNAFNNHTRNVKVKPASPAC